MVVFARYKLHWQDIKNKFKSGNELTIFNGINVARDNSFKLVGSISNKIHDKSNNKLCLQDISISNICQQVADGILSLLRDKTITSADLKKEFLTNFCQNVYMA